MLVAGRRHHPALAAIAVALILAASVYPAPRLIEPEYTTHIAASYAERNCPLVDSCRQEQCGAGYRAVSSSGCNTTCAPELPLNDTCYYSDGCDESCMPSYIPVAETAVTARGCSRFCCTPRSSFWLNKPDWEPLHGSGCPAGYVHLKHWKLGDSLWWLCALASTLPTSRDSITFENFQNPCQVISSASWCEQVASATAAHRRTYWPYSIRGGRPNDGVVARSFSPFTNPAVHVLE
ncbi:hypothetical protein AB1Y20_008636 [Prymnesium parvum]|uniref:Uncharacterized protein n=1 Tax=Prymnesium parvum TaxID=97485 RepID=A0AB34ITS9_PRYPA